MIHIYQEMLKYYNLDQYLYNFSKIPILFEINKMIKTTLQKNKIIIIFKTAFCIVALFYTHIYIYVHFIYLF